MLLFFEWNFAALTSLSGGMVDASDSKSDEVTLVWVQVPPQAPTS